MAMGLTNMPPTHPFPPNTPRCVSGQPPGRPRDVRGSTFKALPMIVTDVEKKNKISGSRKREWIPIAGGGWRSWDPIVFFWCFWLFFLLKYWPFQKYITKYVFSIHVSFFCLRNSCRVVAWWLDSCIFPKEQKLAGWKSLNFPRNEPRKKPWLVGLYRGLYYPPVFWGFLKAIYKL